MTAALQHFTFEGAPLALVTFKDRPAFIAREVGAVLGYAEGGGKLVNKITQDWTEELQEGEDFLTLDGADLAALSDPTDLVGSKTRRLVVLFESGLHGVLLLSRQPKARAMRRWLREEVMPQLARSGTYSPDRTLTPAGELVAAPSPAPTPITVTVDLTPLGAALSLLADLHHQTLGLLRDQSQRLARLEEQGRVALPAPVEEEERQPAPELVQPAELLDEDPLGLERLCLWLAERTGDFALTTAAHAYLGEQRRPEKAEYDIVRRELVGWGYSRRSTFVAGKWRHRWAASWADQPDALAPAEARIAEVLEGRTEVRMVELFELLGQPYRTGSGAAESAVLRRLGWTSIQRPTGVIWRPITH